VAEVELLVPPPVIATITKPLAAELHANADALQRCKTYADLQNVLGDLSETLSKLWLNVSMLVSRFVPPNSESAESTEHLSRFLQKVADATNNPEEMQRLETKLSRAMDKVIKEIVEGETNDAP